jgi:hypothetical protein
MTIFQVFFLKKRDFSAFFDEKPGFSPFHPIFDSNLPENRSNGEKRGKKAACSC